MLKFNLKTSIVVFLVKKTMHSMTGLPLARLTGTGSYLPEKVLSNADLEKMVDTSDEWIVTRTGIKERRLAADDEFPSDMGTRAALEALEMAGIGVDKIDMILVATLTPDYFFPSTAALIQRQLGANRAAALDIQGACTGFIYGLSLAKAWIESGMYKNILVIAAEKLSTIIDYSDRNTCVLFGDGAAAAVVSDRGKGLGIRHVILGADGEQAELIILPAGGARAPASQQTVADRRHYLRMEGKEVFKHAVRRMEMAATECLQQCGMTEAQISWIVPHQANLRIIQAFAKRFKVPEDKVYVTLHKYGNTSASAIAIALDELNRKQNIQEGDNLLLFAFGAGLTWGASILTQISDES
jgi:3-oxoacyl-[acyl-carrier-protein] synthase-3